MKLIIKKYFFIIATISITVLAALSFILYHAYNEAILLVKDQFNEQQMLVAKQTALGIEENVRLLVREFGGVVLFTMKVNELIEGFIPSQGTSSEFWVVDEGGHFLSHLPSWQSISSGGKSRSADLTGQSSISFLMN